MTSAPRSRSPGAEDRRVLIADEESSGRRRLARELEQHGYEVHTREDADAAVDLALQTHPALVVLELRLRSVSGLSLLPRLRPGLPDTRFVVLTSFGSVATAVRAIRLGAAAYLCKPVTAEHLLASVSEEHPAVPEEVPPRTLTLDEAIWEHIHQTIESSGSLSEAARRLGLWRQSLKRMISKYRPEAQGALSEHSL